MRGKWRPVAGAVFLLLMGALMAACGHKSASPQASAAASSAKASASAIAQNPKVRADEVRALNKLEKCTAPQGVTYTVVSTTGTAHATVTGLHANLLVLHHFKAKVKTAIDCAVPPSTRASVKACVKHLPVPTSKAKIGDYVVGIADCMVGAPQ